MASVAGKSMLGAIGIDIRLREAFKLKARICCGWNRNHDDDKLLDELRHYQTIPREFISGKLKLLLIEAKSEGEAK